MNIIKSVRLMVLLSMFATFLGTPVHAQAQTVTGSISGVVRDSNNIPITGISIPVGFGSLDGDFVDGGCSDSTTGTYEFTGIPLDSYVVEAGGNAITCGSEYTYAREYWQNASFVNTATPVVLNSSQPDATNIDFTLEPGGTISGTVFDVNGDPITGGRISIALYLASQPAVPTEIYACTESDDGTYQMKHIPLGFDYRVSAVVFPCPDNLDGYGTIYAWPDSPTNSGGTTLTPTLANPELNDIDFTLHA